MMENQDPTKILIVDDDAAVRAILMRYLEDEYPCCVDTHSPFDALNKIKRERFSLVISDVMMPGMSGTELLQYIKKHDPETAVIMVTGVLDVNTAVDSLRLGAFDFVTKPFDLPSIRHAVKRALERRRLLVENRSYQEELERKVRERTEELNGALREVEESYKDTLEALVTSLDAREHETQAHSQRVREYTLTLAREIGLEAADMIHLGRGALLHDVGKIGVPDSILLKPAKLTSEEWVEMKKHPVIGFEILRSIKFLEPAAEIVLRHQERWDGKGYPSGCGKEEIPLGARIFAVADTLDAMTSDRPYRRALSYQTALAEIRRCSGTQFDPRIVEVFLGMPPDLWVSIHEHVSLSYMGQSGFDLLCRI